MTILPSHARHLSFRFVEQLQNIVTAVSKHHIYSMLNTACHTVNIKWLLLYSCAPVTQTRPVFNWDITTNESQHPVTLTNSDGHRESQKWTFDYSWVFFKFRTLKLETKQPPWSASSRHTPHSVLSLLPISYITPLTSRFSCCNPCVTSAHLLCHANVECMKWIVLLKFLCSFGSIVVLCQ